MAEESSASHTHTPLDLMNKYKCSFESVAVGSGKLTYNLIPASRGFKPRTHSVRMDRLKRRNQNPERTGRIIRLIVTLLLPAHLRRTRISRNQQCRPVILQRDSQKVETQKSSRETGETEQTGRRGRHVCFSRTEQQISLRHTNAPRPVFQPSPFSYCVDKCNLIMSLYHSAAHV